MRLESPDLNTPKSVVECVMNVKYCCFACVCVRECSGSVVWFIEEIKLF